MLGDLGRGEYVQPFIAVAYDAEATPLLLLPLALGRENGMHHVRDYMHDKSVWVNFDQPVADPFLQRL